ncbi:hypothetical protein OG426_54620 (plasmid) [Streptomyces canus]|uniref:WD40/YVTN/BNR-like repeat-containing protein n=1 Tax=Streptomyces canus TaxID=58343 RepID=UPI002F916A25|nr:hypothetical protein OG426_54620 [Streptomyces canus]
MPTNKDRWESVGPYSSAAKVQCLPRPGGNSLILVSSRDTRGGFWSEDSGNTWQPIQAPTRNIVSSLVGNRANPQRWWLSTTSYPEAHKSGIFRTDDKGASWERLAVELPEEESFRGEISAHNKGQVLVAVTGTGTRVSRDGGDTWQDENITAGRTVRRIAFLEDDLIFQPSEEYVLYAVRDAAGEPQPPVPLTPLEDGQQRFSWDGAGHTIGVVFLGPGGGLVISRDAGNTWADPRPDLDGDFVVVSASGAGDQILHQSSAGTQLDTGDGIFRKVDWPGETVADFCQLPEGTWLGADRDYGLYSTMNWGNFNRVGVPSAFVTVLAVPEGAVLAGTRSGLFRTTVPVSGPDWEAPGGLSLLKNEIVDIDVSADNRSVVWRARQSFRSWVVECSVDAGMTWQWTARSWDDSFIYSIHSHPQNPDLAMVSYVRIDIDEGVEVPYLGWTTASAEPGLGSQRDPRLYVDFVADPDNPDGVWMVSLDHGLYYSSDFGETYVTKTAHEVNTVLLAGSRLLIGGDTIRYSDDGGTTFHDAFIEHYEDPLRVVAFAQHDDVLFAGTTSWYDSNPIRVGQGVMRSRDNGKTWHDASGDLPFRDVQALAVDPEEPCLYAGLHGGSVHRLAL